METLDDCLSTRVCFGISIHIIGKRCIGLPENITAMLDAQ